MTAEPENKAGPGLALFQPDIPGNTGALMRLASCMGIQLHVIEPAGFRMDDKAVRRAGLDYADKAALVRHGDWDSFRHSCKRAGRRIILLTTRAEADYVLFQFLRGDILLFGSESAGVPEYVHVSADARLTIPMEPGRRSLNVALAAAMVFGEVRRQMVWEGSNAGGISV